jgi:hypothetical protein
MLRVSAALALMLLGANGAYAELPDRQSRDDAWWTGPVIGAGAATLPQGHFLIEPYVYDAIAYGHYDNGGTRRSSPRVESFGSQTYLLYGLVDKVTVGLIPRFGYSDVNGGRDSSKVGVGDLTFQAQYRLTSFTEGRRIPTVSVVLQETVPTGKFDRLGDRAADGQGAGAYVTTLSVYSQYYLWMPNGRILRTRFNVSRAFAEDVSLEDESVYGTPFGFRGEASPGASWFLDSSWEYSVTRNWVLALDLLYQRDASTRVKGTANYESGSSRRFGLVPAVEYNWTSRVGVIVGARWIADGRNADATITPVAAINIIL